MTMLTMRISPNGYDFIEKIFTIVGSAIGEQSSIMNVLVDLGMNN